MFILKFLRALFGYARYKLADQTGAITIPQAWVHGFHAQLLQIMQQTVSLVRAQLMPRAQRGGVSAVIDTWERVGNVLLQPVPHHGQTIPLNPNHTRRGATMQTLGGAIYLQPNIDAVRMLIQPQSDYRDLLAAAAIQSIDKAILDGSIGTATTITTSATTGQITYGSQAMLTAHTIGATGTAMDLTRIIAANVLLSKASVPTGAMNRAFFYSPGQETDIMAITQASSSDFTKNRLHDAGTMDGYDWQGFHWVQIPDVVNETTQVIQEMLQTASSGRYCIAMYRGGVGYSSAQEPETSIDRRPDLNNLIQVYLSFTMGVVRLWEGAVVRVSALEN